MTDKDQRTRRLQSARKSAPVSARGVNARRLALHHLVLKEKEAESAQEEEKDAPNFCRNPFCKQQLGNRYAQFCEKNSMCQRYRALKLQCFANAQVVEDNEDTKPLAVIMKRKASRKEKDDEVNEETFAIPRKKKKSSDLSSNGIGKRRFNNSSTALLEANEEETRGSSSSPRPKEKVLKIQKKKEKLIEKKKEAKRLKKKGAKSKAASKTKEVDPPVAKKQARSATLNVLDGLEAEAVANKTLLLGRQSTDNNADTAEAGIKRRQLNRCLSADNAVSRSTSSLPVDAASEHAADTNDLSVRAKPRTPKQVIRKTMEMDLVPLGVAKQSNSTGGGRYVQNGNRSAALSLMPLDSRTRPPSLTKFPEAPTPAVSAPKVSSQSAFVSQPTLPPQTQRAFPVQCPQPSSLAMPGPTPRAVKALASPVRKLAVASIPNPSTSGMLGMRRISTSDYLRGRQGNRERLLPRERIDRPLYCSSSSLERTSRLTDDRALGVPSGPLYSIGPPRYNNGQLPSYREPPSTIDPRPRNLEVDRWDEQLWDQHSFLGNEERSMGRSRESWEMHSEFEKPLRNLYADRYQFRQEEVVEMGEYHGGNDYAMVTHFNPSTPPLEQLHERGKVSHESVPPRRIPPSLPRIERQATIKRERIDCDDLGAATFSYHEAFLPNLLSVFINQFPHSLEAVLNVTKKPRKMNWYIRYVERIERLCKDFELKVTFDGPKAVVTVRGREWLVLHGTSTTTAYSDLIKSLRAEAITWLRLYEEMEKVVNHYRDGRGDRTDESTTFLRAWNELKRPGNPISLDREANYFYGARLHHWNFVVGKVEIGSGSHEEKREAFRLAAISALDFLLSIGRGRRHSSRHEDDVEPSSGGRERISSRQTSTQDQVRATETSNGLSAESVPSELSSSSELPLNAAHSSFLAQCTEQGAPNRSQNPLRALSSGDPEDRLENAHEQAAFSDQSDEMSISDCSDKNGSMPTRSQLPAHSSSDAPPPTALAAEVHPASTAGVSTSTSADTSNVYGSQPPCVMGTIAGALNMVSTRSIDKPGATSRPHCMMCEMIRLRKPNGAQCLRCQQNSSQKNATLGTLLGSFSRAEANQL